MSALLKSKSRLRSSSYQVFECFLEQKHLPGIWGSRLVVLQMRTWFDIKIVI